MEFIDSCIILKIKRKRHITSDAIFFNSYTVSHKQEYEVKIHFHSTRFTKYRRYSQFLELRERVKPNQIPLNIQDKLPPFPKKKILQKSSKLTEERMVMLEKWIKVVITFQDCQRLVLGFLDMPDNVVKAALETNGCKLNGGEKIIAMLVKNMVKVGKNSNMHLKRFDDNFFIYSCGSVNQIAISVLLRTLIPLCGDPLTACTAIKILYKLLRIESYKYCDNIKQALFNNIELLREIKIESHILNKYNFQTGQEGYTIAKIVKEHFDRNDMNHYFKYFLNFNEEAYEKFGIREEGKAYREAVTLRAIGEWSWLNTDNYPGGLKIGFRKMKEFFELKSEIFIEAPVKNVSNYIKNPIKRKEWDIYMDDIKIIKKIQDLRTLVWYSVKKDKKTVIDMSLECHIIESLGHSVILFNSILSDQIPTNPLCTRVECSQSYYEVQSVGLKIRRSSSTIDEIDSEEDSIGSYQSNQSHLITEENKMSKLSLFVKMKPEMARCFVNDLSEETSVLKESLVCLKKIVENSKTRGIFID